jgi:hypothetical protein
VAAKYKRTVTPKRAQLQWVSAKFCEILERIDQRCMAADGPVTPRFRSRLALSEVLAQVLLFHALSGIQSSTNALWLIQLVRDLRKLQRNRRL